MKRMMIVFLTLLLLAVPVLADTILVQDDSGLLEAHDAEHLDEVYSQCAVTYGFTPSLVTTDSFGGITPEEFAAQFYDIMHYPDDGIMLLLSLEEEQWYIFTSGQCYTRFSEEDIHSIADVIVPMIQQESFYPAFLEFPKLAAEIYEANAPEPDTQQVNGIPVQEEEKAYGKTILICMGAGLLIGLAVVGWMAVRMKSVRMQNGAADYIRKGSVQISHSRDIFLYSHVTRTAKPKQTNSHGSGGRGGSGGRL